MWINFYNLTSKAYCSLKSKFHINDWTTVSNWAIKVGELYPDLLEKANKEAANHKNPSTGLRELAARISSWISTGDFAGLVEVDESERPRKVRYLSEDRKAVLIEKEIDEDTERSQKIKQDLEGLSTTDSYRLDEMQSIADSLNSYFRLDFEVDHSQALLHADNPGKNHPDNLQLLIKSHNRMKSNSKLKCRVVRSNFTRNYKKGLKIAITRF